MRAITGSVLSHKPCSLAKAARILALFADSAASLLPSSDSATYLRTATEATNDHHLFRRDLRRHANAEAGQHPALEVLQQEEEVAAASGKKSKRKEKHSNELLEARGVKQEVEEMALVPYPGPEVEEQIASEENHKERRSKKKKKKHDEKQEEEARDVKQEVEEMALVPYTGPEVEEEIGSENRNEKRRRKKKKHDEKQEEEASDVKELKENMVHNGASEQGIASGEKKMNKRKHLEEADVKEKMVINGDLAAQQGIASENKRKKKRGRGDDNDNDKEQVEHTRKKPRKQS